jgi:hypothetical protein
MLREASIAAAVCCSGLFGPPLNKAYPAEDKPHLPAYLPVATSQSLAVLSPLTEAKVLPSGLNATE